MEMRNENKRNANKRIDSIIGYVASVGSACLILMWSVFNTWLNVLQYRAAKSEEADVAEKLVGEGPAWEMTGLMVLLTCVIPFLFGLVILFRAVSASNKKSG